MLPNKETFKNENSVVVDGKEYFRTYRINQVGNYRLIFRVVSINSDYKQGLAFAFGGSPKFKGQVLLNGVDFLETNKKTCHVIPVDLFLNDALIFELTIESGCFAFANASDFLDDHPDAVEMISFLTNRKREDFRGCTYTSGFEATYTYGNAFWIESISKDTFRFYCNDHKMDDDFDDFVFEVKIQKNYDEKT